MQFEAMFFFRSMALFCFLQALVGVGGSRFNLSTEKNLQKVKCAKVHAKSPKVQ